MDFDFQNFGLGLLTGWLTAYAAYLARPLVRSTLDSLRQGASQAQNSATRSADSRYINDLVRRCETGHLAGTRLKLSDILIEPRFLPPPEFDHPRARDEFESLYRVVPVHPDLPALHANYNLDCLTIDELANGSRALALLGLPGSGRTTALMAIALHSLGMIRFAAPLDSVQQRIESEEAKLSEKARAVRLRERVLMEQRAKEQLAQERGGTFDAKADETAKAELPLFKRLMPVYVHFGDLLLDDDEFGGEIDPAEPLVRAVQFGVGRLTASNIPRNLYRRISEGQVLLLLDGYDDLGANDQLAALAWLKAFREQYSGNFLIVAAPAIGYGSLTRIGLTPISLRPWSDVDVSFLVERWAAALSAGGRRSKPETPTAAALERARSGCRGLSPLEITLKIWANFADDAEQPGIEGWFQAYLTRTLGESKLSATILQELAALAQHELDSGSLTSADLRLPVPEPAAKSGRRGSKQDQATAKAEDSTPQSRFIANLMRSGLLRPFRDGRYQFRHQTVTAYLASFSLQTNPEALRERIEQPRWRDAVAYAALRTPMDEAVESRLKHLDDILRSGLTEMGRWMAYAPLDAEWRGTVFKRLDLLLNAPNQYPLLRERAVGALVESRDTRSALLVFKRAIRSANTEVRRLGCIGIGAMGDPESQRELSALLNDQNEDVRIAAALALNALQTEDALEPLVTALLTGSDEVRQAAAEGLAMRPADGYSLLFEALSNEDMLVRRAAVLGVRRLNSAWSFLSVYRAFLEDTEWFVRSAAQQAFEERQFGRFINPTSGYPSPEGIEWLINWTASKGDAPPKGDQAAVLLGRVLTEAEPALRKIAATNLGQLGITAQNRALYTALRDRQEEVRAAAHAALAQIQIATGLDLPAPAA